MSRWLRIVRVWESLLQDMFAKKVKCYVIPDFVQSMSDSDSVCSSRLSPPHLPSNHSLLSDLKIRFGELDLTASTEILFQICLLRAASRERALNPRERGFPRIRLFIESYQFSLLLSGNGEKKDFVPEANFDWRIHF